MFPAARPENNNNKKNNSTIRNNQLSLFCIC